jgi:hypothetical protein
MIHSVYKKAVDVVALKITPPNGVIMKPINKEIFDNEKPMVSDDVFVLGYPYDVKGGGNFPIWKRASIATEPDLNYNFLPQMLVDTATRSGMSGSPVIFRRTGVHGLVDGKMVDSSSIGTVEDFLGIYSGRYVGESKDDAQLGIVWKKQ